ncbi:hypothetical protein EYF80_006019 [Liparis tanakae]|uniref:Uncharacterized protein n=1 Tax=Liparis tanakae TaxID=230148 RepID=A0A4Z2J2X6_9TELE|nr:hypothetical protein EYF80_006019 [Liparis tanakae]
MEDFKALLIAVSLPPEAGCINKQNLKRAERWGQAGIRGRRAGCYRQMEDTRSPIEDDGWQLISSVRTG